MQSDSDQNGLIESDAPVSAKNRTAARLAAVQALYQMDLTQRDLSDVLTEFLDHRFLNAEALVYNGADREFFRDIVSGTVHAQKQIDEQVASNLAEGWRLSRIDSILRAILRAGVYELTSRSDVPVRVTINEYMNVAHAFFGGDEPGVVNGVLDRVAREKRPREFQSKSQRKP